jgi:putative ABC transport system permease protein
MVEGRPRPKPEATVPVDARTVTPGYFAAMEIPLHRGRLLAVSDVQQGLAVAVIDDNMARTLWPGEDPIGKRLRGWNAQSQNDPEYPWLTVVGIVGGVHYDGLDVRPRPQLYRPVAQGLRVWPGMTFVVRAGRDPAALAAAARAAVRQLDPTQPIAGVRTLERVVADSVAPRRFALQLLGIFACLALALAAVGVYGVTYDSIVQRTRELGLRIALGAQPRQVLSLLAARAGALVVLGLAIGLAAALAATRAMSSMLYGVSPADPATYAGGALLLILAALLAVWIPGRRATHLDPMTALRSD